MLRIFITAFHKGKCLGLPQGYSPPAGAKNMRKAREETRRATEPTRYKTCKDIKNEMSSLTVYNVKRLVFV